MRFEFVHFADAHVGTEQYRNPSRYLDFARTYRNVIGYCVGQRVKLVLIAGDLFNSDDIWATTHDHVCQGLQDLRDAGIAVVAVRGNHERPRPHRPRLWLHSLASRGLLHLLDIDVDAEGRVALRPWCSEECAGGYLDLDGVRIVGLGWQGAQTAEAVKGLADALSLLPRDGIEYTIVVAHAAMAGYLPGYDGGLTYEQIAPLEPQVDYLALGHIHKSYQINRNLSDSDGGPWIFNPGSLDTYAINEWGWDRGFYHVKVDTAARPRHDALLRRPALRPVVAATVSVTDLASPEALQEAVRVALMKEMESVRPRVKPIAQMSLTGTLRFSRADFDIDVIEQLVNECCHPLVALVKDHTSVVGALEPEPGQAPLDREQLELETFKNAWAADLRYRERAEEYARFTADVKDLLLSDTAPEKVAVALRERFKALDAGVSLSPEEERPEAAQPAMPGFAATEGNR